jgi:hypothetical protein
MGSVEIEKGETGGRESRDGTNKITPRNFATPQEHIQ